MFGKKLAVTIVIVAAVAISGVALAAGAVRTDGVEPGWQKALAIRSEALDRKYHLGKQRRKVISAALGVTRSQERRLGLSVVS